MNQGARTFEFALLRGSRTQQPCRLSRLGALLAVSVLLAGCRPTDPAAVVEQPVAQQATERAAAPADGAAPATAQEGQGSETASLGEPGVASGSEENPEVAPPREGPAAARRLARPLRPGVINDITFDDLELDLPVGTLFNRALLTPRAAQLDGQQVRLRGFIYAGGVFQQTGITSFPFVKNTQCKFGPQGLAYCVLLVNLDEGVTTDFTTYPVTVEGTLTVDPYDEEGCTWSVYHLQGQRVF